MNTDPANRTSTYVFKVPALYLLFIGLVVGWLLRTWLGD